jgi:two-component system sensor kinase FixL
MRSAIRILLVDDDPTDRAFVIKILRSGLDEAAIKEVDNRAGLHEALADGAPDVIVTDYLLRGLTGLEVIELARSAGVDAPVIILTGTGTEEIAIEAMQQGAADYVLKSITHIKRLPAAVSNALAHYKAELASKQAWETLRKSEILLRTVVDSTQEAIISIGEEGTVTLFNPAAEKMFGRKAEDMLGQPLDCLMPEEYRKPHAEYVRSYFATGKPDGAVGRIVELPGLRSNGEIFPMDISLSASDLGDKRFVIAVARDITKRKQDEKDLAQYRDRLEELVEERTRELNESREALVRSERLASVGILASGIAHEINNPVGMILLAAENAITYKDRPDAKRQMEKCLNDILISAERCGHITKSILQFAKKEATEKVITDVNDVIERAALLTGNYVKEHGGAIDLQLAEGLRPVMANSVEMEQVFVNLIQNAMEAASGYIRIIISTMATPETVRTTVEDNGPGIPEKHLRHLFDPFFTTHREKGGTGLGLSIVHGIIVGHRGHISVENRAPTGTVFTIDLPYATPAEEEA